MKIEIHVRDSEKNGKRIGLSGMHIESYRVYKEAKDGSRMDKFASVLLSVATGSVKDMIGKIKANSVGVILSQPRNPNEGLK